MADNFVGDAVDKETFEDASSTMLLGAGILSICVAYYPLGGPGGQLAVVGVGQEDVDDTSARQVSSGGRGSLFPLRACQGLYVGTSDGCTCWHDGAGARYSERRRSSQQCARSSGVAWRLLGE